MPRFGFEQFRAVSHMREDTNGTCAITFEVQEMSPSSHHSYRHRTASSLGKCELSYTVSAHICCKCFRACDQQCPAIFEVSLALEQATNPGWFEEMPGTIETTHCTGMGTDVHTKVLYALAMTMSLIHKCLLVEV